jgi:hypothetical protein
MPEISQSRHSNTDEIDLIDIFKRLGKAILTGAIALGQAILISIVFILRRWLPLTISIVLGLGASHLMKFTSPPRYKAEMILRNNAVSNSDLIDYINRLQKFCGEGNTAALANALSLKPEKIDNIFDIAAFWIIDNGNDEVPDKPDYKNDHSVYDTLNVRMQDRVDIRVITKSPQELSIIKNGIISFINSDSLFQQTTRLKVKQNAELLARLNNDILQLDSLQKVKYFEETRNKLPKTSGQIIFLQEQRTQLLYTDIYELYTKKQKLEGEISLFKGITTILSDFYLPAKRVNGTAFYAKYLVPLFILVTLFILVILANRKMLIEVYHKY